MIVHNKQNHLNHLKLDKTYYAKAKAFKVHKKPTKKPIRENKPSKPIVL